MATFRQAIYAAENIKRFAFDQVGQRGVLTRFCCGDLFGAGP